MSPTKKLIVFAATAIFSACLYAWSGAAEDETKRPTRKPVTGEAAEREVNVMEKQPARPPVPPLTRAERHVLIERGTERPFSGKYWNHFVDGAYACRACNSLLYLSTDKFKSNCGWPSFDDEILGAVRRLPDPDGRRTEIRCARCDGHLGHVFLGERFTPKNMRHCVNSLSLVFVPREKVKVERAILAGGCFWGVEHFMKQIEGVISTGCGYTGGDMRSPSYRQVCTGRTHHAEAVEVVFDPTRVTYETIVKRFFEIHDPTQLNRQGPDVGTQYRSVIYYTSEDQRRTAKKLIEILKAAGYDVVTELVPAEHFWAAEGYHQDYVTKHADAEICHAPVARFGKWEPKKPEFRPDDAP